MFISDLKTAYRKDPALKKGLSFLEVFLYQGLWAIWFYRISHFIYQLKIPFLPRLLSQIAFWLTNIEIHPGASIGRNFFIDHGTGVVIGETAVIGNNVMLYHGVTLGGHGWWTDEKGKKRHPTIEDNTVIGVGASILGPVNIGANCRIGANTVIINDIPANSTVVSELGKYIVYEGKPTFKFETNKLPKPEWFKGKEN